VKQYLKHPVVVGLAAFAVGYWIGKKA